MAEGTSVIVTSGEGLTQHIVSGDHEWRSDEPAPDGTDAGPSPYELLLSSLGACATMTLRMYANRKGIDLRRVTARLQHFRTYAEDCLDCDTKPRFLDHIDCEILVEGDLTDRQKQRLLEIAERCPVHRTLMSRIDIRTSLG